MYFYPFLNKVKAMFDEGKTEKEIAEHFGFTVVEFRIAKSAICRQEREIMKEKETV